MDLRRLAKNEIPTIWTIDRSEVHHYIYRVEEGELVLFPAFYHIHGWSPEQMEQDTPLLEACYERGGTFMGMFDGDYLVGVTVVDTIPLGVEENQVQLKYLYVSKAYRGQGVGAQLMAEAKAEARKWGAMLLYISATPTQNTVDFYLRMGAELNPTPDPELFALEPEDIHLLCPIP